MKIYPSKHRIKQIAESNIDKDITIPLAYLNNEHISYSITKQVHDDFSNTTKIPVLPNAELENENVLLFDEFGNPAESDTIINRVESRYFYYPNNMIEFTPLKFSYNVIAKRKLTYSIANKFNLNIKCVDDKNKLDFVNTLSKILMVPSDKKYLPNNIIINNNSTSTNSLTDIDYENTDFVFVKSSDGLHYDFNVPPEYFDDDDNIVASGNSIPYETFLSSNINTWIICDDHYKYPISNGAGFKVSIKSPVISAEKTATIKDYYNITDYAFKTLKIHNIFENDICPVLIVENENKGYTIYSSSELFNNETIDSYKHIIYEVLMYVYCNSYKTSKIVNESITYTMPDYEVINNSLCKKTGFTSKITLDNLLKINMGKYRVCSVNIFDNNDTLATPNEDLISTVDNVICTGISNNKLTFKLDDSNKDNSIYQEPEKPLGWSSVFYNDKIYYLEQIHYFMETNIGKYDGQENKLYLIEKDADLLVRLYPFKSSKYGLNITKDLRLIIPFIKTTVNGAERIKNEKYVIYMNLDTNALEYVYEDDFKEDPDKAYLALIVVEETKSEQYLTDMRLKGGGLPEDLPDNFNLLDIGHIYGRPYRQANTLVITLPKKYEPYKNEILEVINKYKVAEDYPVLFFEDDETDGE